MTGVPVETIFCCYNLVHCRTAQPPARLERTRRATGLLVRLLHAASWRMTVATLLRVLRSVEKVHALGISHGDIAPRNVFVSDSGRPVLGDFDFGVVWVRSRSRSML